MTTSLEVGNGLVDLLRRDLLGPHPDRDGDLAKEVLDEKPSRWYVSGVDGNPSRRGSWPEECSS